MLELSIAFPVRVQNGGLFISRGIGSHPARTLTSWEVIFVERGELHADDNPLKNAPHTAAELVGEWSHPYSREQAVFPLASLIDGKYWPPVGRVDNVYGDRNLACSCPSIADYQDA